MQIITDPLTKQRHLDAITAGLKRIEYDQDHEEYDDLIKAQHHLLEFNELLDD